MTANLLIDQKHYADLLGQTLPCVIKTEEENERFLSIIEALLEQGAARTPAESQLLELITLLVEKFEQDHYSFNQQPATPDQMIRFLMEQRDLRQKDLLPLFSNSRGLTADVVNGNRPPSKNQAKKLAEFFQVSVDLFL